MNEKNCTKGVTIVQIPDECNGGNYLSTSCVQTPNAISYLDLAAGSNQTQINAGLVSSLIYKDQQISEIPVPDGSETKIIAGDSVLIEGEGTSEDPYIINSNTEIPDVSSTVTGLVNNTSLQELGGVDKLINDLRIGRGAGNGLYNSVLGTGNLSSNTTGNNGTGIGYNALFSNTTGQYNTSLGSFALYYNTTGSFNTALGGTALTLTTTGTHNTGIGLSSLYNNTTGSSNTAIGSGALSGIIGVTSGVNSRNIALGANAGNSIVVGSDNILIGADITTNENAGLSNGSNNIIIGKLKTGFTTGSGNTFIGRLTALSSTITNNVIVSDGVGNIVFRTIDTGATTLPRQTNSLINLDSTGKAAVTKEYLPTVAGNYANDAAAASGGVLVGQMYHTSGTVKIRLI